MGRGEGLEVGEHVEYRDVGEVGGQKEVEAELWDGGERWEVPVVASGVRDTWEGGTHGLC